MNKIILAGVALSLLCTPALAGNKHNQFQNWQHNQQYNETYNYNYNYKYKNGNDNDAWIAGVGGFVGGLLLGEALNGPGAPPPPGYYAGPTPQEFCGTRWETRWNDVYQQWEKIPHTVCWVQ